MAKLSKEEAEQLAALRAKEEAPDEPEGDDDQGDDGHVIVLRGSRADSFLESLLGPPKKVAKKAAAPARGNGARTPAATEGDDGAEEEGDGAEEETPPKSTARYFR